MGHQHEHHHDHHHEITSLNKAFIIGISLNLVFVVAEFLAGFWYNSLGLLSDAGHNLGDVASLVLAMLAFRLAKVQPTSRYTYGYKKSTVLVSLLNAVILLVAVGIIIGESVGKLFHPQPVEGDAIAWVAGIGVVINAVTAWLFMKDKDKDLNVKGAYLHMAADALVSVGVVVSGLVIARTGWYVIDPVIGLLIALIIIYSTWGLLRDSLRLSLDGVPMGTDIGKVENAIREVPGVQDVHHLHIWAISTTETALTAHIVIKDTNQMETVKHEIKHELEHVGVQHATLEFETTGACCSEPCCE
ncbi:cation transporter [Parabacteroides sp. AF48-14]|uniref:cation diffusion facilitator family transporter n=1 Tax=Parabacteroides sp. AF48-14 TaxID=2292052 RepID=UPI000EFEDAEA|nr:cation diffusion facilitator family transporter [Parabacteroides sp. AF48-14]RHO67699.1 cation transporter [Parabacteroides sp. AF48-14]